MLPLPPGLACCRREVRLLSVESEDPLLVGLTQGAEEVLKTQETRHCLNMLKTVQLLQVRARMASQPGCDGLPASVYKTKGALSPLALPACHCTMLMANTELGRGQGKGWGGAGARRDLPTIQG